MPTALRSENAVLLHSERSTRSQSRDEPSGRHVLANQYTPSSNTPDLPNHSTKDTHPSVLFDDSNTSSVTQVTSPVAQKISLVTSPPSGRNESGQANHKTYSYMMGFRGSTKRGRNQNRPRCITTRGFPQLAVLRFCFLSSTS